jgi:hypothetical protein
MTSTENRTTAKEIPLDNKRHSSTKPACVSQRVWEYNKRNKYNKQGATPFQHLTSVQRFCSLAISLHVSSSLTSSEKQASHIQGLSLKFLLVLEYIGTTAGKKGDSQTFLHFPKNCVNWYRKKLQVFVQAQLIAYRPIPPQG